MLSRLHPNADSMPLAAEHSQDSLKQIPEIEGLRAIAVIAVVLFHAQFRGISGGYVGVDVFFVISGYLITGLLWREWNRLHSISLKQFYMRRILRLAPALLVTVLAIIVLFFIVLPPMMTETLKANVLSALTSASNFWFYFHTDYFSENFSNPVLHTWSLAVEEQFYLTLPLLLLLLAGQGKARVTTILLSLALASLVAAEWVVQSFPSAAFYLPWLRAWELLVGAALAVSGWRVRNSALAQWMTLAGLAAIVTTCLMYSEKTRFPGISALPPVLGTAAVIAAAGHNHWINRLVGIAPLRWMGKISYSVYLVHWPIICLLGITVTLFPFPTRVGVLVMSLLAGWLSWKWVEMPFRRRAKKWPAQQVIIIFLLANVAVCAGVIGMHTLGEQVWNRFPQTKNLTRDMDPVQKQHLFRTGLCFLDSNSPDAHALNRVTCITPSSTDVNALIMGDSHAANLWRALQDQYPQVHFMQATATGCRPLLNITAGLPVCLQLNQYLFSDWLLQEGHATQWVVLAGRWERAEIQSVRSTVAYLQHIGKKVLVVGPTPEYYVDVPLMLAYENVTGWRLQSRLLKRDRLDLDRELKLALKDSGVTYFSMVHELCQGEGLAAQCKTIVPPAMNRTNTAALNPMWEDRDHFSAAGANYIMSRLAWSPTNY